MNACHKASRSHLEMTCSCGLEVKNAYEHMGIYNAIKARLFDQIHAPDLP